MKHGEAKDRQYGAGAMGQGVENAHGILWKVLHDLI